MGSNTIIPLAVSFTEVYGLGLGYSAFMWDLFKKSKFLFFLKIRVLCKSKKPMAVIISITVFDILIYY